MRKILLTVAVIIVCLSLFGCKTNRYYWEFEHTVSEIESISIIEVTGDFEYSILSQIKNDFFEEVCRDIASLEMKRYGTNLAAPYGKCFMIVYQNQEYDVIAQIEPKRFRFKDGKIVGYNSWLTCDGICLEQLIQKYS